MWWGTAAGFLVGAVYAVALLAVGRNRHSQIAFGPFMIVGALSVSLVTA